MKIRNGFVSNSSSSSFVIFMKDEKMSFEDRKSKTIEAIEKYMKPWDDEEAQMNNERAEKIAKDGKYMVSKLNVEWGGEQAINTILPVILQTLDVEEGLLTYEWSE